MKSLRRKNFTRSAATRLAMASAFFLSFSLHANYEEVLYSNNFSGDTVANQPTGFEVIRPITNRGAEDPFPIGWEFTNGPIGALIVGDASQPQPSLPGTGNKSLRIYDYTSSGTDSRGYVGKNFVPDEINNRYDVRLDLSFQRSHPYEMDENFPGDRLLIALGEYSNTTAFNSNINRGVQVSLTNDGEWTAHSNNPDPEAEPVTGLYNPDGVNDLTMVANAHPDDVLAYDGPTGPHTLAPFTYSLYINGARVVDGLDFQNKTKLGKLGFVTGYNNEGVNIDFVIDDIVVTGLREMEFITWELDLAIDFEQFTTGTRPTGFTRADPTTPVGPNEPFPITASSSGPHGTLIVDETSAPASSFNGKGVRLYDYNSGARAKLSRVFLPVEEDPVPHVRFDFSFRRSLAMVAAEGNPGQGMIVALGAPLPSLSMHVNAARALQLTILNNGTIRVAGDGFTTPELQFEPFGEIGTNEISIFANSDDAEITFEGPDGETYLLNSQHFSVFLNGAVLVNNRGIRPGFPVLGKFAFCLGQSAANTDIDFVVDDIRISNFRGPIEPPAPALLRIGKGLDPESLILSWNSTDKETYGLEHSADLVNWEPTGATFTGDGALIEHPVTINSTSRRFFRLISPVEIIPPGTLASLLFSHEARLWTNVLEGNEAQLDPALTGTYEYQASVADQIGKAGRGDEQRLRTSIQGFELPTLEGPVESATYTVAKTGLNGSPNWSAQIYIFDPSITPEDENPEDIFYSGAADTRSWMRPVSLNAFSSSTLNGAIEFTLTAADLAGFYNADGTPASVGGMIWFRVNPSAEPDNISNFHRLEIEARLNQADSPTLRVVAVE